MKSPSKATTPTKLNQRSILSFFSTSQSIDNAENSQSSVEPEQFSSPSVCKKFRILDDADDEPSEQKTPLKQLSKKPIDFSAFSSPSQSDPPSPTQSIFSSPSSSRNPPDLDKKGKKEEVRYPWLVNIRDKEGNPPDHPNYNPKTLYIPPSQWKSFTPFERQYWEIKNAHYDCLVFFKKGKFYELYEGDADIGAREFDLKTTDRVNMRMAGIPESSFDYWAGKFISKGYKIAKVDQLENGIEKEMREQNNDAVERDKIIKRELSCVLTGGTIMDAGLLTSDLANFCLCLKFTPTVNTSDGMKVSAVFVETSTGKFFLCGSFVEDGVQQRHYTQLETLIAQIRPREIVAEHRGIPQSVVKLIKNILFNPIFSYLPGKFCTSEATRAEFENKKYFASMPTILANLAKEDPEAFQCFGGLVDYLACLKLDRVLLSYERIISYSVHEQEKFVEIDGQTLLNLEVFQNCIDGTEDGTLVRLLDFCLTAFGKRLFRFWVAHPLSERCQIEQRQQSVELLFKNPQLVGFVEALLHKLPDLERIGCRIHAQSCKLTDFILALEKWRDILAVLKRENSSFDNSLDHSSLLYDLLCNQFPIDQLSNVVHQLIGSFDLEQAKSQGSIIPSLGAFPDYDQAVEQLKEVESNLDKYLQEQRKKFRCQQIQYKDLGKELFQLEIPVDFCQNIPNTYVAMSKTKSVYRYWTSELKTMIKEYQHALERKRTLVDGIYSKFLERYDSFNSLWSKCIYLLAQIDCLYSLYKASSSFKGACTKPQLIERFHEQSYLSLKGSVHPCVPNCIPNDLIIGQSYENDSSPLMVLLTGPNMGGKSTLLRQVCIQVILAQIGCYCPAEQITLAPFTKIFTRIGANDNIMNGQSTFMVELAETARILHHADERSLVILDELGRGTSTYDGYAIAYATLHYLLNYRRTRGLFSTHYHMLGQEMAHYKHLSQSHMGYIIMDKGDMLKNQIVFLYQLTQGACNQSFGMNVARMAGIPDPLIEGAQRIADEFENLCILKNTTTKNQSQLPVAHIVDQQFLSSLASNSTQLSAESVALIRQTIDSFVPNS